MIKAGRFSPLSAVGARVTVTEVGVVGRDVVVVGLVVGGRMVG